MIYWYGIPLRRNFALHKFTSAVILAAGNGTRFESDIKKQYITVGGVPAVVRCMQTFEACPLIDEIVLVGDMEELRTLLSGYTFEKLASVVRSEEHTSELQSQR